MSRFVMRRRFLTIVFAFIMVIGLSSQVRAETAENSESVELESFVIEESFDEILSDITEYESYCATHQDFKNNRTKSTEKIIIEVYEHCLRTDSFL